MATGGEVDAPCGALMAMVGRLDGTHAVGTVWRSQAIGFRS